jgi:AIR synthase-related protein
MSEIGRLAALVRESRGVAHKRDIAAVVRGLGLGAFDRIPVGDDTALIPDPNGGYLLFAMEGFVADFVAADPWFAGYCGVMVNLSDIAAMGGSAIGVADALWSQGEEGAAPILEGMAAAASKYGVPVLGGHSNLRAGQDQLAVAVLGRTEHPITSFGARPGDALLVATDLRGAFRHPFPWWDASTSAPGERLRGDLALLPAIAPLVTAGKDISMAGVAGTAMMLAEASGTGMAIDIDLLPHPEGVGLEAWLPAFPSFGFILTADPSNAEDIATRFAARGIACHRAGTVTDGRVVSITHKGESAHVWNFDEPFTGCTRHLSSKDHCHA